MIDLIVDALARRGESALWCGASSALHWTDIEGATLSPWHARDGSVRVWVTPERVGSFALCANPAQLLLGLASGTAVFNLEREVMTPIVPVEAGHGSTRFNDGRCDQQGRFVFGTFNPAHAPLGRFYRVHADLSVETDPLPAVAVANSIAFSPDGMRMYFADSPTRVIYCVDCPADGRLGVPGEIVRLGAHDGHPDGSPVDADGGLRNAQWDGTCLVRYSADGIQTDRLTLPTQRQTCSAFGGTNLDRLFVSTGRIGLDERILRQQGCAGGVFALSPGRRGQPEHRFATSLRA